MPQMECSARLRVLVGGYLALGIATTAMNAMASSRGDVSHRFDSTSFAPLVLFTTQALAPAAVSATRVFGKSGSVLIRQWRQTSSPTSEAPELDILWHDCLPRYTGAGETAIHTVLRTAEIYIRKGYIDSALHLLYELRTDLENARAFMNVEPLMDKWNARVRCVVPVDIMTGDLNAFIKATRRLYRSAVKIDKEYYKQDGIRGRYDGHKALENLSRLGQWAIPEKDFMKSPPPTIRCRYPSAAVSARRSA